jgi:cyclic beta-1,2-glucan synthetase
VRVTDDSAVFDENVPFLAGQMLQPDERESFFQPTTSNEVASLYEHCARALDASLAIGAHGLPLIGGGDWNDGMNRVGEGGKGESVWLAWMLYTALNDFAGIADARGDQGRAAKWRTHIGALKTSLESQAWDGQWYRRGWFDDGSPLGSAQNEECRIDSIAQSWAVISGAAQSDRAAQAMAAAEQELILPHDGLALLFTPPFDRTPIDPGYIKGYPPGMRENGGQYTHAALWSVIAFAFLGEGDKAAALFWMLNPINHARTRPDLHRYKVEPYVVAADVYAASGNVGRGGWTWYTGSAGWMQRAGIESILEFASKEKNCDLILVFPRPGLGSRSHSDVARRGLRSRSRIHGACRAASPARSSMEIRSLKDRFAFH